MGEFEEETYPTVFTALKHPIRRKILRTLNDSSRSFTDIQNAFNVNGAVLTYHLEAMKELIFQNGKRKVPSFRHGCRRNCINGTSRRAA
jgi:DNA-binding transcriptional ArsR family regulator